MAILPVPGVVGEVYPVAIEGMKIQGRERRSRGHMWGVIPTLQPDDVTVPAIDRGTGRSGGYWRPSGRAGDLITGRYRLESLLGTGGMGAVWRAWDLVMERPVAVKEFAAPTAGTRHALQEARAAALVDHPAVVTVHDVAVTDRPWLVMDLIEGRTLAEEIKDSGRLLLPAAVAVARELLSAVSAVHDAGLVHRDVKPSNVLLDDDGHVTLTDFGLASAVGVLPAAASCQILGSPPYMAPETLQGRESQVAGDLFSYGATLFAAVEGRRPFEGDTSGSTVRAVLSQEPPPMCHAGPLEPLISGLLRKDPQRRLSARQASAHLANVARDEPAG